MPSKATKIEERRQLGVDKGTATGQLKKLLLFEFAKRLGLANCIRCGLEIASANDFTVDHKKPWFHIDVALFWDLENIGFSHDSCNKKAKRHWGGAKSGSEHPGFGHPSPLRKLAPTGVAWCGNHKDFLPEDRFTKARKRWNGLAFYCKECDRKLKRARKERNHGKRHS